MTLLDAFDWLEQSWIGAGIRESPWLFPAIEATHLLALALIGGAVLMVDLRLLGVGLNTRALDQVVDNARPWLLLAIAGMFATGIPLFLSEAIKCYYNYSFWVKMIALLTALVFTFAIKHPLARRSPGPVVAKALGLASIAVWFTVAAAGRWIGFSG